MNFSMRYLYRAEDWLLGSVLPIATADLSYVQNIDLEGNVLDQRIISLPANCCRALLVTARRGIGFATQAYPTTPKQRLVSGDRVIFIESKHNQDEAWIWVPLVLYAEALEEYDHNYSESLINSAKIPPKPVVIGFEGHMIIDGAIR